MSAFLTYFGHFSSVTAMNRCLPRLICMLALWLAFPQRSPAPLIYTPGEGWRYEKVGESGWQRTRAKDQLDVAQAAFDKKDYSLALKAAKHTVTAWPFSDFAPQAQYLLGRCYEEKGQDEKAFKAYQKLIEQYPKISNYEEVLKRQFLIANRFLGGQWFRAFGYIPVGSSMDKTIKLYDQIIKNGPYSDVAPLAQMNIGLAYENQTALLVKAPDYPNAAKTYELAADRYAEQKIGTDALYRQAMAYNKQARRAEYDQNVAAKAIATYTDFIALHPEDARVEEAHKMIEALKTEQARGSYEIARFYEKGHRWQGALIYYNEVLLKDPTSKYADEARQRIDAIKKRGA